MTLKSSNALSYASKSNRRASAYPEDDKFGGKQRVRRLGSDDELGLTNEIVGPSMDAVKEWGKVDAEMGYPLNTINVKREVDRSSVGDAEARDSKRASRAF